MSTDTILCVCMYSMCIFIGSVYSRHSDCMFYVYSLYSYYIVTVNSMYTHCIFYV